LAEIKKRRERPGSGLRSLAGVRGPLQSGIFSDQRTAQLKLVL